MREPQEIHYNNTEDFYLYNKVTADKKDYSPLSKSSMSVEEFLEDDVKHALENLPLAFREVILYSDLEGLSYEEISDIIGCPIGTVKSRLFRSRRLLQKLLWNYASERGYLKESREGEGNK